MSEIHFLTNLTGHKIYTAWTDPETNKHRPDVSETGQREMCARVLLCTRSEDVCDREGEDRERGRYTHTHIHTYTQTHTVLVLGRYRQFFMNRQIGVSVITNYSSDYTTQKP